MAAKSKAKAGSVVVFERNQLLSLRWSWRGKRYQFSPKLQADVIGKAAAEMKARQIEIDMATGQFDPTLAKYKGELVQGVRPMTGQTLLTEFAEAKAKLVAVGVFSFSPCLSARV